MLPEHRLCEVLPASLRKDVVSTHHEVPISPGSSMTVIETYCTPKMFRWVMQRWLEQIPPGGDLEALRRALPKALESAETFHGYVEVPDAFGEAYLEELQKGREHRADLDRLKRALPTRGFRRWPLVATLAAFLFGLALNLRDWAIAALSL